jgi:hypothetical protein
VILGARGEPAVASLTPQSTVRFDVKGALHANQSSAPLRSCALPHSAANGVRLPTCHIGIRQLRPTAAR